MANNRLKEGEVVNVAKIGVDFGYYLDAVDKLGKQLTDSITKSLNEQQKAVSNAMSAITKNLTKDQKKKVDEIAEASKSFSAFKKRVESENITLNIDDEASFAKAFNREKQLTKNLDEAKKKAQQENAAVEKKLYEERLKYATHSERQQMKEQEVAIIQKYKSEQQQVLEVSKAKKAVLDEERLGIINNSELTEAQKKKQLKALEEESLNVEKTIAEASANTAEAAKREAATSAEVVQSLKKQVDDGISNNDVRLQGEKQKKLTAAQRAANSQALAEKAADAKDKLQNKYDQNQSDANKLMENGDLWIKCLQKTKKFMTL